MLRMLYNTAEQNPSNAAASLPCCYCKSASVLAIYTALALLTGTSCTTIIAFFVHGYIHSGPNTAIAGGCSASATASFIITHFPIIQRKYTTRNQSGKIWFDAVLATFLGCWVLSLMQTSCSMVQH
jgi:hypothetical protein